MRRPRRGTVVLTFLMALLAVPSSAAAAGTRMISFDEAPAPCHFATASGPLNDAYAPAFGVTFRGPAPGEGGTILDEVCGIFGVTGYSPPNILALNKAVTDPTAVYPSGKAPRDPETIGFHRAAYSVSIREGEAGGGTVTMTAFDATTPVATSVSSAPATSAMTTLSVNAARITSVKLSFTGDYIAFDDLRWATAPVAPGDSYSTTENSSLSVPAAEGVLKNDSDEDGDPMTAQLSRGPGNGSLTLRPDGSFTYTPRAGFSGTDTFAYRASDGGGRSPEATVTLQVNPLPPPPPPPPSLIPSTVSNTWLAFPAFTKAAQLAVDTLPAGTRVRTQCKTKKKRQQRKGCPYKSRTTTVRAARSRLNLVKPFKRKKLPIGTRITITVTAPGFIGKRFRYTIRRRNVPKKQILCIPPGGKPRKKCT